MSFEAFVRPPRSTRWRLVSGALACLIEFSIFFPLAAGSGAANGVRSVLGWAPGLWLWVLSLGLLLSYLVLAGTVRRASVFYALEHTAGGLGMLGLLVLGLSMTAHLLGGDVFVVLAFGLLVGWATMATRIPRRRRWIKAAIERGHLAKSLSNDEARWNPQYDYDKEAVELREFENRGCLTRVLPWIGPAIGMSLADVVGRWNTMVIVALILLAMGYWALGMGTVNAVARHLELRRLERELGRPIYLEEDVTLRKG